MKNIYKRMKRIIFARIFIGATLIFSGVVWFLASENEVLRYCFADQDIIQAYRTVTDENEYYKADIDLLLDYYASDDYGYYYIMPVNQYSDTTTYMGCYIQNSDRELAEKITDATWEYFESGVYPETVMNTKGYVYTMSYTEEEYFREWFEYAGADSDIIDNLIDQTYVIVPRNEVLTVGKIINGVVSIAVFGIGVYYIIATILGRYKKKIKKVISERGLTENEIEYDLLQGAHFKLIDIGRKYSLIYAGMCPKLVVNDDILWAYLNITSTKHRINGIIPAGTTTTYAVYLCDKNRKTYNFNVNKQELGDEILRKYAQYVPHTIVGYTDELASLYKSNIEEFNRMVDERRYI